MARRLLIMTWVRVLVVLLAVVLAGARPAAANEVDDRAGRVAALEKRLAALAAERKGLAQAYDAQAAAIAELKAQPSAWGRDRKLQTRLAESQAMAGALDAKDGEIRAG